MTNEYGNELLHKVLLSAMKDIDKICRENGLRYYLHAGTLLGAFNHKGFIPWDDDVDITMLREDYDKLVQIINNEYSDKYFMQTYVSDPKHTNNRGVLRVLGTSVSHIHGEGECTHSEIGVDIVPLYPVPSNIVIRKLQQWLIWIWDVALQIKQGSIIPHNFFVKCIGLLSKCDRVKIGKDIDRFMRFSKKNDSAEVGILCYTYRNPYTGKNGYDNEIWPRKWYEQPKDIAFEDAVFMTISEPEAYLDYQYGPHWHEPYPEEKRITKHDVKGYEIEPWVLERIGQ